MFKNAENIEKLCKPGGGAKRLSNIEFLRFCFVLCIVVYHLFAGWLTETCAGVELFQHIYGITRESVRAVDFFFIISGFFLVYTFKPDLSVIDFIKKKIIRLWPVAFFAIAVWTVFYILGFISADLYGTLDNVFGLFMINDIGITRSIGINIQSWYVSSLMLVLISYFYMLKYLKRPVVNMIIAAITLFCYSFIIQAQKGSLTGELTTYYYVFNVGVMRAFAGCGLGYLIASSGVCENLQNSFVSKKLRLANGIFELGLILFLFYNMLFNKMTYTNDMIYVVAFVLLFIIFIKNNGIFSKLLNNKISEIFGKYAYSIFMTHRICFAVLTVTLWKMNFVKEHNYLTILLSIIISIAFGVVVYYVVEQPCARILKRKFFNGNKI